jgi:hypothetical protein
MNADFSSGPIVVRATGALDVYDYIQTNIIVPFAKIFVGVDLIYEDQFNDVFNPFEHLKAIKDMARVMVTDYILKPDSDYLIVETKFQNNGEDPVKMPVGDWVNGSGTLELFVPKKGFVKAAQVDGVSALVYQALEDDVDVSYGLFFNPIQHIKEDGTIPGAASLSVAGVTPMVYGEHSLLNLFPLPGADSKVNFSIDPGVRTLTRYFVVGTGDVASVVNSGFEAVGISKVRLSGQVTDGSGGPVKKARVVVVDDKSAVTVALSDGNGNFSADVSAGADEKDKLFGSGSYSVEVYKEGYFGAGLSKAGKCSGGSFNGQTKEVTGISCRLGSSGTVTAGVNVDGNPGPARLTIVGFDPSPIHTPGEPEDFGKYHDISIDERPYGIVDVLYIDPTGKIFPRGNPRMVSENSFRLEPGEYEIFFTRGPEYSVDSQRITVAADGQAAAHGSLRKVVDTSGYVSGDFHVHGINSPDSPFRMESRIQAAMAEGLDVLVGTDHEYLTDYQSLSETLGYAPWLATLIGDEITPLAYGHMVAWPLVADPSKPDHGAYDYTYVSGDELLNPDHDLVQGMGEIMSSVDKSNPGTQVLSVAHITHEALGNFAISRLVTSPAFGVTPLSTYGDPVFFRLSSNTNAAGGFQAPFPLGTSSLFTLDFTSVGLTIGTFEDPLKHLVETSLPTYFNLLNLGKICSATGDSDTHAQIREPLAIPRNFVVSSVDPEDGIGSFSEVDSEELAVNVNAGRMIVSNGVFIRARLISAKDPSGVTVGGTLVGSGNVTLDLEITSNEYFDWDTVEVYANTEPVPAKDDMSGLTDLSAEEFHSVSHDHLTRYLMTPSAGFYKTGSGANALNQTVVDGVRKAHISKDFHFNEDTWVVVLVRGSKAVRSTFPFVPKGAIVPEKKEGETQPDPNAPTAPAKFLETLANDPVRIGGISAFAFTNPMFVDVDGNGFESLYIRDGTSPLAP